MSIPSEFMCPISMDLMTDPVVGTDGHTYERSAITEWLTTHNVSPLTRRQMSISDLQTNFALLSAIERWRQDNQPTTTPTLPTPPAELEVKPFTVNARNTATEMVLEINTTHTTPVESVLIAVLDVSGSMESSSSNKPQAEGAQFSRLDLVKHSMKTLANLFAAENPNIISSLGIVSFSTNATLVMPVTKMDTQGLRVATAAIDRLRPDGATNIWDGLRVALTQASLIIDRNPGVNVQILLLTDGEPSPDLLPLTGIKQTLKRKLNSINGRVTISTFGFGYNLDCELLESICEIGNGTYGFIPDCSMVGTVFINWAAKALLTLSHHISVKLLDNSVHPVGDLIIGRPQTILLPRTTIDTVDIMYDNNRIVTVPVTLIEGSIQNEQYIAKLKKVVGTLKTFKTTASITSEELRALKAECQADTNQSELVQDIIRDIESTDENEGQLMKACSTNEWWTSWGRNHCISYYRALYLQQCVNFKDRVLQHFATSAFKIFQDKGIDIFSSIPAPTPTAQSSSYHHSYYGGAAASYAPNPNVVAMGSLVSSAGPCFTGNCKIIMEDCTHICVDQLKKGDKVEGGYEVVAILYTPVNREIEMVEFTSGLQITPWHPMKLNADSEWVFPQSVGITKTMFVEALYNLVLDTGHTVWLNDYPVVTLGHDFRDNDVIAHPYFGTHAVIDDLKQNPNWEGGFLVMDSSSIVRSAETGMIQKL